MSQEPNTEAAPPETVTLTIDGQAVTVPKGTNVIRAAKKLGNDISAFCFHEGLEVVAVCRQCLVAIEGQPKLVPACQAIATDGMVVLTKDASSTDARRQQLEFTLLNHPVDCPICDKAGECLLQRHYFDHDNKPSRVDVEKVHKPKVVDLGPHVVLDAERCILCTRCIRVCDEVAGQHQLEISHRGDHSVLGTAPGARLDNPYSLNTVDVCPVGALTSKDFRFKMRAWELMMTPSVCTGCSNGCNIEVHHKNNRVWRLVPRLNPDVNGHWMCDEGRFTYHSLREDRLAGCVVEGLPAQWDTAIQAAAQKLKSVLESDRSSLGVVLSPHRSNEDNYVLARLAREVWQIERIYVGGLQPVPERADERLMRSDVTPNRRGIKEILGEGGTMGTAVLEDDLLSGDLKGLLVLGHELPLGQEALASAGALDCLVVISAHEVGLAKKAHVSLAASGWAEDNGSVTNIDGRVQRLQAAIEPAGQARPAWEIVCNIARACDSTMSYESAEQIFSEMKQKVAAFAGSSWGRDLPPIQLRFAHSRG